MSKFRPLSDNVFVKRSEKQSKTKSGILIADTAYEVPNTGTVVSVGPGKTLDSGVLVTPSVKVGDTVVFDSKTGHLAYVDGIELLVLKEEEIFAVVE